MEPIAKAEDLQARATAAEFHGVAGWPAQPKLMPVVIVCKSGSSLWAKSRLAAAKHSTAQLLLAHL